jgi:hypothetical protein
MALEDVTLQIVDTYRSVVSSMPLGLQSFVSLFLVVFLMVVYSVFVWKLHKFIGTKNIFELNLKRFNKSEHPFIASLLYFLEYIIILPILIFFWFAIFGIFLILVMELDLKTILFISAAVIATVRIAAYIPGYGEALSREIAKLLPLNLLAIALLTPDFFDVERIIGNLSHIGEFFSLILSYLAFIIILEILLRFFELFLDLLGIKDTKEEENEE